MKHWGRWLLFEQLLFVPKHVTLSEKMRLAWLVSIPASCFFDQQALHDKKLKGDICGFLNWDWKIWKQSLSISEHCKKTTHRTTWPSPIFLNLSRASCMCGCVDINWVTVMRAGADTSIPTCSSENSPLAWQSFCADTSPKLEVSTPCPKRKRTREDAILKRQGTCFNPHFPRQSVNCYGRDNRGCCEYRLPEKNRWIFHIETE